MSENNGEQHIKSTEHNLVFYLFCSDTIDSDELVSLASSLSPRGEHIRILCDYDQFSPQELTDLSSLGDVFPFLPTLGIDKYIEVTELENHSYVFTSSPLDNIPEHWPMIFRAAGINLNIAVSTENDFALPSNFQQEKLKNLKRKLRREYSLYLPKEDQYNQNFGELDKVELLYICLNASFGEAGTPGTYGLIAETANKTAVGVICPPPSENIVYENDQIQKVLIPDVHRLNKKSLSRIRRQVQRAAPQTIHMLGQRSADLARHLRLWGFSGSLILDIRSPLVAEDADTLKRLRGGLLLAQYYCDTVFAHCPGTVSREFPVQLIPFKIVPPGILKDLIQARNTPSNTLQKFVFIGNISKSRKIENLVIQFSDAINTTTKNLSLDIYGDGNDFKQVEKTIRSLKAQSNIRLMGRRSQVELGGLLKNYDAGIAYVPDSDHFGVAPSLKSLEYAAAGLTVFVSDTRGHREFSCSYGIQFEYFGENKNDLANTISEANNSKLDSQQLAEQITLANKLNYARIVSDIVLPEYRSLGLNV